MADLTAEGLVKRLEASVKRLASSTPTPTAQAKTAGMAVADVQAHFDQGRSPAGIVWPPLGRPRRDGSRKPLVDTGRLRAANRADWQGSDLVLSNSLPYAGIQDQGNRKRKTPARPFLGLSAKALDEIAGAVAEDLANQWALSVGA